VSSTTWARCPGVVNDLRSGSARSTNGRDWRAGGQPPGRDPPRRFYEAPSPCSFGEKGRAFATSSKTLCDEPAVVDVGPRDARLLETYLTDAFVAGDVASMSTGVPVLDAVVLGDKTGFLVEQVGNAHKLSVEGEDGLVDQRGRQGSVQGPDQAQPCLLGRTRSLGDVLEHGGRPAGSSPGRPVVSHLSHLPENVKTSSKRHVSGDDQLTCMRGTPELVEEGSRRRGHADTVDLLDFSVRKLLVAQTGALVDTSPRARSDSHRDGSGRAIAAYAVEEGRPVEVEGSPAGQRRPRPSCGQGLDRALLWSGAVDVAGHVETVTRTPPPRPGGLRFRRSIEARGVNADGAHDVERVLSARVERRLNGCHRCRITRGGALWHALPAEMWRTPEFAPCRFRREERSVGLLTT
jgi:hypothetical protein